MNEKFPYYECKNKDCGLRAKEISRSCKRENVHKALESVLAEYQGNSKLFGLVEAILEKLNASKIQNKKNLLATTIKQIIALE